LVGVTSPEHVIVLALENRSFDHLLGYLPHPSPAFDGLRGDGPYANPGWDNGPFAAASPDAKVVLPVDPDHSHGAVMEQLGVHLPGQQPSNQGFVTSYERKGRGLNQPKFEGILAPIINALRGNAAPSAPIAGRGPLIMRCHNPRNVPVLSTLALNFAVCTRWFCSVPGETWPNRNFLHAATSDGETDINPRPYTNRTIFELLEGAGKTWHIYYDDTPQVWAFPNLWDRDDRLANWFKFDAFAEHVGSDVLPTYSFIEPNHRPPLHTLDHEPIIGVADVGDSQHPGNNLVSDAAYDTFTDSIDTDFHRAERLIGTVYQALLRNPGVFSKTLLLITYDEHGGFYDHVPPPTDAVAPGGAPTVLQSLIHFFYRRKEAPFNFTMLGPRVPAIVVSPFIDAGTVDTQIRDHTCVPATLRKLFAPDQAPLTPRDAAAVPFDSLLRRSEPRTDLPDLSAILAALPAPAPAVPAVPSVPAAARAAGASATIPLPTDPPSHYQDLVTLADQVRAKLGVSTPVLAAKDPMALTATTSDAFADKAARARGQ